MYQNPMYWLICIDISGNCPPGTYVDGENCIPCDLGFYQNEWRKSECKPCGENRNTSRQGAESIDECQGMTKFYDLGA